MVVRPLFGYFRWSLSDPSGPTLEYVKSINTTYLAQIGLRALSGTAETKLDTSPLMDVK